MPPYTENRPGGITTVIECVHRLKTRLKTVTALLGRTDEMQLEVVGFQ